jgi:hypothetical protein
MHAAPARPHTPHSILCYLQTNHGSRCAPSGCLSHWAAQLAALLQKSETVPDLHLCLLGLQSCVLAAYLALAALPLLATQQAHLAAALHRQMKGLPPPRFMDELLCLYGSKKLVKLPFPQIGARDCLGFARQIGLKTLGIMAKSSSRSALLNDRQGNTLSIESGYSESRARTYFM